MICVKKKNTNEVKDILHNKTWGGGVDIIATILNYLKK